MLPSPGQPPVSPYTHLLVDNVGCNEAQHVPHLHGARGPEAPEGTLGHAREHVRHRVRSVLGVKAGHGEHLGRRRRGEG